jgi:ferrous iron transport protein B
VEFILIGQPNCGKSTIFNEVIGYKSVASNFPGITVQYTQGDIEVEDEKILVTDLPGTYSLQTSDEAELAAAQYLFKANPGSVIINIIDASVLSRSLELTLQLMEMQKPMVIALNMMDDVKRKGLHIDIAKLSDILGVPVIPTIGRKGEGIFELFREAHRASMSQIIPNVVEINSTIEPVIRDITNRLERSQNIPEHWNSRFMAIKVMEKDRMITEYLQPRLTDEDKHGIDKRLVELESSHHHKSEFIISSFRHNMAFNIFEKVAKVGSAKKKDIRQNIDNILMHPIWGYAFLIGILYLVFYTIFKTGDLVEPLFTGAIEKIAQFIQLELAEQPLTLSALTGLLEGVGGGIAIAVPFLLPFFIILSILEDTGYLARIAYLTDNIMHRIGLHGMSVVPMILGYGCTVPGILATRILKSPRDKFITATLTSMIPCSARMIVIFGLVGALVSVNAAMVIYFINILVLGVTGKFLAMAFPEVSPGLIMEIPRYHAPDIKTVWKKTWFRLKEFLVVAWPLIIAGSVILELVKHFQWHETINNVMTPFTSGLLGLPAAVGIVLVFGIMRKELALFLLASALNVSLESGELLKAMTPAQIYSFTLFVTFYVPCIATIAVLARELSWKKAGAVTLLTLAIAIILATAARFVFVIF